MKNGKIIVIGGGPAGIMASGIASQHGANVLLLEKSYDIANKLKLTGNGRCNFTHLEDKNKFLKNYNNTNFIKQIFKKFFYKDLIEFFQSIGIHSYIDDSNKVFPKSNSAVDVVNKLKEWIRNNGVKIETNSDVKDILVKNEIVCGVKVLKKNKTKDKLLEYNADSVILCAGGKSFPQTGSDGSGCFLAKKTGHKINYEYPALVPLIIKSDICKLLEGISLRNISVNLFADGKKIKSSFGDLIFTKTGISGPAVFSISRDAVIFLNKKNNIEVSIDMIPSLDEGQVDKYLLKLFNENAKKKVISILKMLMPDRMALICFEKIDLNINDLGANLTSAKRKEIKRWLKDFRLIIVGNLGFKKAMVTSGGILLNDVNYKTMESKLIKNLYFAGEVLDIDGDTGGYNLQSAFTTGYIAGLYASFKDC